MEKNEKIDVKGTNDSNVPFQVDELLTGVESVAIAGHVKPDGDCTGSTLALYNYIKNSYPEISVTLYLEPIPPASPYPALGCLCPPRYRLRRARLGCRHWCGSPSRLLARCYA